MYFFEQFGSGHSSSTGEGGGLPLGVGATLAFLPDTLALASSSPARLFLLLEVSGRGGTNGVGDEGAVEGPEPFAPRRPFWPPPFLNLLCTDERVSNYKYNKSVTVSVDGSFSRDFLPRPLGVRVSRSLVGESQNL